MGALGSLFGTAGKLASWSTKLLGPNSGFLSKALGKTLEMVNVGGTWLKNAYTSVSTAISNGMDRVGNFFKTGEFKLSADRTSVFSQDFSKSLDTLPTGENVKQFNIEQQAAKSAEINRQLSETIPKTLSEGGVGGKFVTNADGNLVFESNFKPGELNLDAMNFNKTPYGTVGDLTAQVDGSFQNYMAGVNEQVRESLMGTKIAEPSLLDQAKDKVGDFFSDINVFDENSQIRKDFKQLDIYNEVSKQAVDGALGGVKQELFYAVSPDSRPQTPVYNTTVIPDIMDIGMSSGSRGVFNTISLTDVNNFAAPRGNAWQATSMYNTPYINQILNGSEGSDWQNYMKTFAFSNAMTPTVPDTFGGVR